MSSGRPKRIGQDESGKHASAHVELVRVIDRTIHVSPIDRQREVEFIVRNPTDQEFNFLFLPLRQFERDLKVYDEDGMRLNVYPNAYVENLLDRVKERDEEGYKRMQHRFKHADYKLFIQLPPERPLEPGELRTIQLTFEQSDPVEFYSVRDPSILTGWIHQWEKKFFDIPPFLADVERFPGHSHDVFVVVVGTAGYATTGVSQCKGGEPAKEIYENGLDDDTRVMSVRLPPAENRRYDWNMQYDLLPNSQSLMRGLVIYWALAVLLGIGSVALPVLGVTQGLAEYGSILSTGLITATIGLIFALNADWTNRYKLMSVIPLLVHSVAWVLWTLNTPTTP